MKYYLPLNYENLAHYFSTALIAPASFYENRQQDIQSNFDGVLISKNKWIEGCSCSLEIIIDSETDANELVDTEQEEFKFLSKPLPISRIKAIWLANEQYKDDFIYKINQGTAFAPDFLFQVEEPSDVKEIDSELSNINRSIVHNESFNRVKYDNLLGGICLLRSVCEQENIAEFLSFASHINSVIKSEFQQLQEKDEKLANASDYSGLFDQSDEWKIIQDAIKQKQASIQELKRIAQAKEITLEIEPLTKKIKNLDTLPEKDIQSYLYYFIANYGDEDKDNKAETLFNELLKNKFDHIEKIALVFGLYNGYEKFRNEYKFDKIDKTLKVKFKLDSKLDYYLIESAYQRSVIKSKHQDISSFPYLDEGLKELLEKFKESRKKYDDYNYYTITILDTVVYSETITSVLSDEHTKDFVNKHWNIEDIFNKIDFNQDKRLEVINIEAISEILKGILEPILESWFFDKIKKLKADFEAEWGRLENKIQSKYKDKDYEEQIRQLQEKVTHLEDRVTDNSSMTKDQTIAEKDYEGELEDELHEQDLEKRSEDKSNEENLQNTDSTHHIINDSEDFDSEKKDDRTIDKIDDEFNDLTVNELTELAKKYLKINKKDVGSQKIIDIMRQLQNYKRNHPGVLDEYHNF